jgi:hypothetical protein
MSLHAVRFLLATLISLLISHPAVAGSTDRPVPAPPDVSDAYRVEIPGKGWAVEVDLRGFVIQQEEVLAQGQGTKMMGEKTNSGIYVSMFMEPRPSPVTAKSCRDDYWTKGKDSPSKKVDVELSDPGEMSLIKWLQPDHQGIRIDQQHVFYFLGRDNVCTEIHMSKINFKPGEETLFGEVLRTVRYKNAPQEISTTSSKVPSADRMNYRFTVSKRNRLKLALPIDWHAGMRQDATGSMSTIRIWPNGGDRFEMLLSRIPRKNPQEPVTPEFLIQLVQDSGQKVLSQSAEQKLEVKELGPGVWKGYYFRLADKAPRPNEYKYMTQGAMSDGSVLFTFTFLTNSEKSLDQRQFLDLLSSAKFEL